MNNLIFDLKNSIQNTINRLAAPSHNFFALVISLFVLFFFLRVYEFTAAAITHSLIPAWYEYFLLAIIYDLFFVFNIGAVLAIPFLILSLWNPQAGKIFFAIISSLILILHLGLLGYFISTNIPLGSDFYGYSWKDIQLTISSSTSISIWTILPFAITLTFASIIFVYSQRVKVNRKVVDIFFGILFFSLLFSSIFSPAPDQFEREESFNLSVNKSMFFYEKSFEHFSVSEESANYTFPSYPLYRKISYQDVLGKFFKRSTEPPNLVFIIVEGLGRDFVGKDAYYGGFTPFIDSLSQKSLYWDNFLSTSGRTFNVLPSLLGSLPYGRNGFMEMGEQMPAHQTLVSLLKLHGYYTSFYYGGNANFDLQDVFLGRQGIDFILDQNQFGQSYRRAASNEQGFSWGYDDGDVFKRSLEIIAERKKSPRLDIYLTLSTHEPFEPPNKNEYLKRFEKYLINLQASDEKKKIYRDYKEVFSTLLYFDDALHNFLKEYETRADYNRTIFFITGDHRLIPVPLGEQIDRFRVPFIIYSPMLQQPIKFSSVSTHADLTPTLLAFLSKNYNFNLPEKASWLSNGIDTSRNFRNVHSLPLMRNKNELIDFIFGLYYLTGNRLYRLLPGLGAQQISNDSIQSFLQQNFYRFKQLNNYVCRYNRLYPDTIIKNFNIEANQKNDSLFAALKIDSLGLDDLFEFARFAAFNNKNNVARIVCRKLLQINPRNLDYKLLLGRTYAWEKDFTTARLYYFEVLHQMPNNPDALSALIDIELWTAKNERALFLSDSSLANYPENQALLVRKSKALANLGKITEAKKILRHVLVLSAKNEEALALKEQINK